MPTRLTPQSIKAMTPPPSGNVVEWDTEVTGLGARITAAGKRSFVLRYVLAGQERRMTLGGFPELSLSAARDVATRHKGDVAKGIDPLANRQAAREAPDMRQLCADYLARHAERHKRPGSARDDRQMIDGTILPALGRRRVAKVTQRDIEDIHGRLKATPYRANRVLALLSKMFALAIRWHWRPDNPVKGVERYPEHKRERWLSAAEVGQLAAALDRYPHARSANAIRLLLLTGARRSEALSVEWAHIDFERGVWTKPSAHTKQKKTERVPLSPPALALLGAIKAEADRDGIGSPFVFPGDVAGQPLRDIKKAWRRVCETATVGLWAEHTDARVSGVVRTFAAKLGRAPTFDECQAAAREAQPAIKLPAGLMDVRLHDLRHTFASHLVSSGLSLPLVGKLLGHTQAVTTQRYAHLADDPLREATGRFGAIYEAAQGKRKPADVVPLRNAGDVA